MHRYRTDISFASWFHPQFYSTWSGLLRDDGPSSDGACRKLASDETSRTLLIVYGDLLIKRWIRCRDTWLLTVNASFRYVLSILSDVWSVLCNVIVASLEWYKCIVVRRYEYRNIIRLDMVLFIVISGILMKFFIENTIRTVHFESAVI